MSHKKNEDIEMRRIDEEEVSERESFLLKPPQQQVDSGTGILSQLENNPGASVLAYCFSSISMTVVNKYVVSGSSWNLNFLYLAIQVCAAMLWHHTTRPFN
jgi:GDP-mannose transporter